MKHTFSAGGIVINSKGQVVIVNQHGYSWSLPKGHIEAGEDALCAAKREIYEEAGVGELELVKELGTYSRPKLSHHGHDHAEFKTITIFLFKTHQEILQPHDTANPYARWVEKDQVVEMLSHPKDKEFFLSVLHELPA